MKRIQYFPIPNEEYRSFRRTMPQGAQVLNVIKVGKEITLVVLADKDQPKVERLFEKRSVNEDISLDSKADQYVGSFLENETWCHLFVQPYWMGSGDKNETAG